MNLLHEGIGRYLGIGRGEATLSNESAERSRITSVRANRSRGHSRSSSVIGDQHPPMFEADNARFLIGREEFEQFEFAGIHWALCA
jgi:hypothetical protein